MKIKHGQVPRGLEPMEIKYGRNPLEQGRFGRMFPHLPAATFGAGDEANFNNLTALAGAMTADFDLPKDGPDDEESGIPALYTYFGQFVDHDISFDPTSSLQQQNDVPALVDFRTPGFDLDNVYGRGADDQPYLYDGEMFLQGEPLQLGDAHARDLPRNNAFPRRALIGDPRNDENTIVSQFQGLILRFHNRMRADNPQMTFAEVQTQVRYHYEYVVLNDFLPRIVTEEVLNALKIGGKYDSSKPEFFRWTTQPFMPVEFSGAAYRLGHSMIRPGYRLNGAILLPIFPVPAEGLPEGLTGFRAMIADWGIDWGRFIDLDARPDDGTDADRKNRLQLAYRIDTSVTNPLQGLPVPVGGKVPSLPFRNLLRGWRLGLPSGQQVAQAMRVRVLTDPEINLGKATDPGQEPDPKIKNIAAVAGGVFAGNCPLWTYILAEAMAYRKDVLVPAKGEGKSVATPQLGPVGGRIVAEVFLGLMFGDKSSMLRVDPCWQPKSGAGYQLKDFVGYALGR